MDHRDEFLNKCGRLVTQANQVAVGDILAIPLLREGEEDTVRIYYAEQVVMNPPPPHLFPPIPYVGLKRPHIGIRVSKELELTYFYVHLPMAGESCKTIWLPLEDHNGAEDWPLGEQGKAYVATDELLVRLGQLIPEVDLPSWAFMMQSKVVDDVFACVQGIKPLIQEARKWHGAIDFRVKDFQWAASQRQKDEK